MSDDKRIDEEPWAVQWIRSQHRRQHGEIDISDFGKRVICLLNDLYDGIYHCVGVDRVKPNVWADKHYIAFGVPDSVFYTYDCSHLTRLVLLCHDYCVRGGIEASNPGRIKLVFTVRTGREGDYYERHPTIEQALEQHRKRYSYVFTEEAANVD